MKITEAFIAQGAGDDGEAADKNVKEPKKGSTPSRVQATVSQSVNS